MSEMTVPMDDQALFEAATAEPAAVIAAETPAEAATEKASEGQLRDDQGRFAPKVEAQSDPKVEPLAGDAPVEPSKKAEPPIDKPAPAEARDGPPPGWIPAWRAREIADARTARLEAELRQLREKPQDPVDPYVDPERFRDMGVRQAVDPIRQEMSQIREHYSRENALRVHGQETVVAAYKWLEQATHAGDPRVAPLLQRAQSSIDPYADIVTAFKREQALSTVGDDPNAWFEKELERRKSDPAFMAKFQAAQSNSQVTQDGSPTTVVKLPPSLTRATGAAAAAAAGSMSNEDLYNYAKG